MPLPHEEGNNLAQKFVKKTRNYRFVTQRLVVGVFSFDLQLLLAGFANPVMFPLDEGVVVDTFAVVVRTEIALHRK
jgi:hypothetical protein